MFNSAQMLQALDIPDEDEAIAAQEIELGKLMQARNERPSKTLHFSVGIKRKLAEEYLRLEKDLNQFDSRFQALRYLPRRPKGWRASKYFDLRLERIEKIRRLLEIEKILGF